MWTGVDDWGWKTTHALADPYRRGGFRTCLWLRYQNRGRPGCLVQSRAEFCDRPSHFAPPITRIGHRLCLGGHHRWRRLHGRLSWHRRVHTGSWDRAGPIERGHALAGHPPFWHGAMRRLMTQTRALLARRALTFGRIWWLGTVCCLGPRLSWPGCGATRAVACCGRSCGRTG